MGGGAWAPREMGLFEDGIAIFETQRSSAWEFGDETTCVCERNANEMVGGRQEQTSQPCRREPQRRRAGDNISVILVTALRRVIVARY